MNYSFVLTLIVLGFVAWYVVQSIGYIVQEFYGTHDDNARDVQMHGHSERS